MGKRTSDYVALAAIFGGVGLGYGLTNLFAQSRTDDLAGAGDASVDIHVMQSRIILGEVPGAATIYFRRTRADGPDWEPVLLRTGVEDLRREVKELYEGALEEVDGLEAVLLGDEEEDQRRRRRRRRPR